MTLALVQVEGQEEIMLIVTLSEHRPDVTQRREPAFVPDAHGERAP